MSANFTPMQTRIIPVQAKTAPCRIFNPYFSVIALTASSADLLKTNLQTADTANGAIIQNARITCFVPVLEPAIVRSGSIMAQIPRIIRSGFPFLLYMLKNT